MPKVDFLNFGTFFINKGFNIEEKHLDFTESKNNILKKLSITIEIRNADKFR